MQSNLLQMFKPLNHLKNIRLELNILKENYSNADASQKKNINRLNKIAGILFIFILLLQIHSFIYIFKQEPAPAYSSETIEQEYIPIIADKYNMEVPELDVEKAQEKGIGFNVFDPVGSIVDPIVEAISNLVERILELFDNFVGSTPNIGKRDGQVYGAGSEVPIQVGKFYALTTTIAWLLLPLFITINGAAIIIEGSFKGQQLLMQLGKKVLIFIAMMIITRYIFVEAIDLINGINKLILHDLIGGESGLLSQSLLSALGVAKDENKLTFVDSGGFNPFAQAIIWAGLFFFLSLMLFQFIVRFFHLFLHMILYPIIYVIGLLPGGGQFTRTWVEEIVRTLMFQPIFLIGLAMVIEIIKGDNGAVAKIILGIGALAFLNTIPMIINKMSGFLWTMGGAIGAGLFAAGTLRPAMFAKKNLVTGATGEKSGSLRAWGLKNIGASIVGRNEGSSNSFINGGKSAIKDTANVSSKGNVFKSALMNGEKANGAFSKLGMSPIDSISLKPDEKSKTLFSNTPNFGAISKVSIKDSDRLSNAFTQSNFNSAFGSPFTESPAKISRVANLSSFNATNTQTNSLLDSAINHQQLKVNMGKTFDSSNSGHWGHLTNWYAKDESLTSGKPIESYQKFINDPKNRSEIVKKAHTDGYFNSQGIRTVKVVDNNNGESLNKYYQVKPQKYARNRTSKTK
jgi:hypothetical protein